MQLLDCTLRDGGYYTNWNFPQNLVKEYLYTVSKLPISIVELGYISDNPDMNGPFYHLNSNILSEARKILNKNQKIFVMINAKEIKNFAQLKKLISNKKKYLDGIRFAISPNQIDKFIKILQPVKRHFPKISFNLNLMYFSKWVNDIDFFNQALKKLTNKIDTLAIVDSYGSIFPEQTRNFLKSINRTKLKLGCHFHNNCGLALANTLAAISEGCSIADATLKGMGRGAGNAETELMLAISYRKKNKISGFDINSLLEKFEKMKIDMKWGTSYAYAYAATEGYSQSHMMDLIQKRRLDPGAAVKVISSAENHVKEIGFENLKIWKNIIKNKEIPTLIGGAPSLLDYGKILFQKIGVKLPLILSGSNALFNFYKLNLKIKNPIILILSGSEIKKINSYKERNILKKINIKIIVAEKNFLIEKINFKNKNIIFSNSLAINPLLLAGLVLNKLKIKKMNIAFFDGETSTLKGRTMMKETLESVKILQNKKIKIFKLTQSFLPVQFINPWIND